MKTLFKKDPENLGRVIDQIDPENMWVFDEGVVATRKRDGTACMIKDGCLYKRYDAKRGKKPPYGAIPCQDPDPITGHWPHWVACTRVDPADKYHWEALDKLQYKIDGTYELCGPKINGNKEKFTEHFLLMHDDYIYMAFINFSFDFIRKFLYSRNHEGIVFHHPDGRMCKIRRSDFGFEW